MNIIQLLRDYNIPHQVDGPKTTRGFVNIHCPFCAGKDNYHLGIELNGKLIHCWRCGMHSVKDTFGKILNLPNDQVTIILRQYGGVARAKEIKKKIRLKEHRLPTDVHDMTERHKRYLITRRFDPDALAQEWGLLGTGPISKLDDINYRHRILIPIYWNQKQVSFQTRDITGKHPAKYMVCPEDRELIKHKHILYGRQKDWQDAGIAVEGVTDVWRLGTRSFATFGIEYTQKQLRLMAKNFKRVVIIFDDEIQAQNQAAKLKADLQFRGIEAVIEKIDGDPGDLSVSDTSALLKKIF